MGNFFFDDIEDVQTIVKLKKTFSTDIHRGKIREIYAVHHSHITQFQDGIAGDKEWQDFIQCTYAVIVAVILEANVNIFFFLKNFQKLMYLMCV